ncbi:hypothetical protein BHE74_00003868 [Ensete ventricosum]|nr:hypothetical protein BHE74_00003868 [Ensete ventricosum]RZR75936.1 hypothetical protein BHM03_00000521 [Ensete ventricosum]
MAPKGVMLLPVSDPPPSLRGSDDNAPLFKGSGMTRRGAVAAVSYMACAGLSLLCLLFCVARSGIPLCCSRIICSLAYL